MDDRQLRYILEKGQFNKWMVANGVTNQLNTFQRWADC